MGRSGYLVSMTVAAVFELVVMAIGAFGGLILFAGWTLRLRSLRWYQALGVLCGDVLMVAAIVRVVVAYSS